MDVALPDSQVRRARILELDKEIGLLRQRLEQLQDERTVLLDSLSFPILTLPTEITAEIFAWTLPRTPRDPRSSDAPLLLTRICQQWRNIALSIPQLWTTVSFPADEIAARSPARDYLLDFWLTQSQLFGLSIHIHHLNDDRYPDDEAHESIDTCLDIILRHASRWHNASFKLLFQCLGKLQDIRPDGDFPLLQHLVIGVDSSSDEYDGPDVLTFTSAQQLQSVEMLIGYASLSTVALPYLQLTRITCRSVTVQELCTVLCRSPNLVDGVFVLCAGGDLNHASPPPQLCLKALALRAGDTAGPHLIRALGSLTLPVLETLEISDFDDHGLLAVHSFLQRSSCKIHTFSYSTRGTAPHDEQHFFDCLAQMPLLWTLRVHHQSATPCTTLILRLGADLDLVPDLRILSVSCRTRPVGEFPFDGVVDMLALRSNSNRHTRLDRFELFVPGSAGMLERSQINELVQAGMHICLGEGHPPWVTSPE
ncbi:hypothetical protein DFH07DRAFT_1059748 [Mycena maculata]|uniref:F-box domain-containing protein n=1 Tax=Mycena maculata TaxID=230809 RepID=A0AAD7JDD8_9AGAR|nr:hypothetical protein DFH07DRAFT_1059748 [Mycena maculata]